MSFFKKIIKGIGQGAKAVGNLFGGGSSGMPPMGGFNNQIPYLGSNTIPFVDNTTGPKTTPPDIDGGTLPDVIITGTKKSSSFMTNFSDILKSGASILGIVTEKNDDGKGKISSVVNEFLKESTDGVEIGVDAGLNNKTKTYLTLGAIGVLGIIILNKK